MAGINLSSSTSIANTKQPGVFDGSLVIIIILFLLTVVGFGGLRWYIKTLDTNIVKLDAKLVESSAQLQGKNVDRVAYFDNRLTLITKQLSGRIVDSKKILTQLEGLMVPNVKLTQYKYNEAERFVEVAGETDSFKYVAQQIISFKSENLFADIKVESLARTPEGRIAFSLKAEFN